MAVLKHAVVPPVAGANKGGGSDARAKRTQSNVRLNLSALFALGINLALWGAIAYLAVRYFAG